MEFSLDGVVINGDNEIIFIIRNHYDLITVGDVVGGAKITAIEAYRKPLEQIGPGMTAAITFDKFPSLICKTHDLPGDSCRKHSDQSTIDCPEKTMQTSGPS